MAKSTGKKEIGKSIQKRLSNKVKELKEREATLKDTVFHWVITQGLEVDNPSVQDALTKQAREYMREYRVVKVQLEALQLKRDER